MGFSFAALSTRHWSNFTFSLGRIMCVWDWRQQEAIGRKRVQSQISSIDLEELVFVHHIPSGGMDGGLCLLLLVCREGRSRRKWQGLGFTWLYFSHCFCEDLKLPALSVFDNKEVTHLESAKETEFLSLDDYATAAAHSHHGHNNSWWINAFYNAVVAQFPLTTYL